MTKLTEKQESLLNELLEDFQGNTEAVMGPKGLMNQLRKRVVEAMLDGEMTSYLGYAPHDPAGNGSGNSRNGHTAKKVQSKDGELALDPVYPIIYFDCLYVKSRQDGSIRNKAVYLALGINLEWEKELLGMWLGETEGAKFWLGVFNKLKTRRVQDCFIACVDGLRGLPEAIETVYPHTQVQLCVVHQIRNSLRYVTWKDRKRVAAGLRGIYMAPTAEAARTAQEEFAEHWGGQYPAIAPGWERNWERLTPFFGYPPEIRKVVYTTNAIESLKYSLRKIIKGRGASDWRVTRLLERHGAVRTATGLAIPLKRRKPSPNRSGFQLLLEEKSC